MKNKFVKGILFILSSVIISMVSWYLFTKSTIDFFWGGFPSGIISGILFLIFNFYFFNKKCIYKILVYVIILLVVSICVAKGGDWFFYIFGV